MATFNRNACYLKRVSDFGHSFPSCTTVKHRTISQQQLQSAYVSPPRFFSSVCVECVCATFLRPIWRALNLYRFPFPGLSFPSLELRHAAMQPPPSPPCNTISPINSSPFITQHRMSNKPMLSLGLVAHLAACPGQNSQVLSLKSERELPLIPVIEQD